LNALERGYGACIDLVPDLDDPKDLFAGLVVDAEMDLVGKAVAAASAGEATRRGVAA
jgi:hypothetical protein